MSGGGGQVLFLQDDRKLFWYDMEKNEVEEIYGLQQLLGPEICHGSLLHFNSN
jgi:hypothetical protein